MVAQMSHLLKNQVQLKVWTYQREPQEMPWNQEEVEEVHYPAGNQCHKKIKRN